MSLAQLKEEAAHLTAVDPRELIACLIARQTATDESFKKTLAEKIDNNDLDRWVDVDDLSKRFNQ